LEAVRIGSTLDPFAGITAKAVRSVLYDYGNVAIAEYNAHDLYGSWRGPLPGRMTLEKPDTLMGPSSAKSVGLELSRDGVFVRASKSQDGNYVLDRAAALRLARALRGVPMP
jgi:hypothetical protein